MLINCPTFHIRDVSYNLRKTFVILIIFSILSCKQKDECYPEFKESLSYLKKSVDPDDNASRVNIEIQRNVEVLESISGILNKDRGMNLLNVMFISQGDIANWEAWISEKCPDENNSERTTTKQRYNDAEIQVIDLLHLVETENKEVFAELVAYYGTDKKRHLNTHVDLKSESEKETNNLYFNSLQEIINSCYELKPQTRNINNDFSFVITDSKKVNIDNLEVIRVRMNYCTPDEEECIDKTYLFDFVMGEKEYLLIDIDKSELYKK